MIKTIELMHRKRAISVNLDSKNTRFITWLDSNGYYQTTVFEIISDHDNENSVINYGANSHMSKSFENELAKKLLVAINDIL